MRRWHGCGALVIAWRFPLRSCKTFVVPCQTRLASSTVKSRTEHAIYDRYAVFKKTPLPSGCRVEEWTALLDGALPPHLRDHKVSPPLLTLSAVDLAEVLLAAQRPSDRHLGHDLLYHLGFEQGRWSAVVWLIKKLVDRFPIPEHADAAVTDYLKLWNQVPPFCPPPTFQSQSSEEERSFEPTVQHAGDKGPESPLHLEHDPLRSDSNLIAAAKSLDEIIGCSAPNEDVHQNLGHEALGQIWRTLGAMTQACAGGSIRQEVLEIIAYLHHREMMPMSIYQYQPRKDKSAIQQPPLIPLLSSRILTSLSDAALRAHETLASEEAKARQGDRTFRPGSAGPYRARVDGLCPEVWLELILWSCLHGGWIQEGGYILNSIAQSAGWKPLSWREYERALPPNGQLSSNDWDAWDYLFKTGASKSMDPPTIPIPAVQRTVSAEVVNAYIDAIAGLKSDALMHKATPHFRPLRKLSRLKRFLDEQNLGLTTGSWDALAIRVGENQSSGKIADSAFFGAVQLSPGLGQGLTSSNTQDLPAYVLDGGLAMQGILYRCLHEMILAGRLEPALKTLGQMLARTDKDKQTSLANFMEGSKSLFRALDRDDDMFTSNVTGIEYPAFELQIPPLTLGLLLDLVIEHKEFEFGRWLLYSKDADGPIIKKDIYDDPFLIPALVRFATATQDTGLFKILREMPNFDFHLVLDAQIDARRWDAATGIVTLTSENNEKTLERVASLDNLANLARVMLSQIPGAIAGQVESREDLHSAMNLFFIMVNQVHPAQTNMTVRVQTLLHALSSVNAYWANFCKDLRRRKGHHDFQLTPPQFNNLLDGVVTAYGSAAGRRMLELFWPTSARNSVGRKYKKGIEVGERPRIVVPLPGLSSGEDRAVLYGSLRPTIRTITIILQKGLEELRGRPSTVGNPPAELQAQTKDETSGGVDNAFISDERLLTPRGMIAWAARRIAELPNPSVMREVMYTIDRTLRKVGMEELSEDAHGIVLKAGEGAFDGYVDGDVDGEAESPLKYDAVSVTGKH